MKKRYLIAPILTGIMLLTACGSRYSSDTMMKSEAANGQADYYYAMETPATAVETADYEMYDEAGFSEFSGKPEVGESAQTATTRKLIRNVCMDVETKEFDDMIDFLQNNVKAAGGYIESSYNYNGSSYDRSGSNRSASIVIRIPADKLDQFLADIKGRANVISRNENVQDVTLTYVDMESHKNALRTEEESLINMLAKAESVEDLITIESRLADVRYQIESMESQLRTYDNLVDYATLSVNVSEVEELTPVAEQTAWEKMSSGFVASFHNIGRGLANFGIGVVMNLPYILVWAAVLIAVFFIGKAVIKKIVRKIKAIMEKKNVSVKTAEEAPAKA
ncbi:MAG: DUF4349 domain-containing protein [Lachnospiraceae bacterium]|nr:DUF4349 domain-containing protein [Lachnospiraceae bacterium]